MSRIAGQFARKSTALLHQKKVDRLNNEIEKQRRMIRTFADTMRKKDNEIIRLRAELEKYKRNELMQISSTLF